MTAWNVGVLEVEKLRISLAELLTWEELCLIVIYREMVFFFADFVKWFFELNWDAKS